MKQEFDQGEFIFNWQKDSWDYHLPVFVGLSLIGHFLCFYVFHVIYPPTTSLLPPAAQITVLNPENGRDKNLLDWIEMNDPAAVSAPRFNPRLVERLTPGYKPTFSTVSPQLMQPTMTANRERPPLSVFSTDELLPTRQQPKPGPPINFETQLEIGSGLQSRAPLVTPALPATDSTAERTSLFIGVAPDGKPDFIFVRQSSGDTRLDQKAEQYVRALTFRPGPRRDWGTITFRWGSARP
jgi:TonB family protein